mgnify:CR=1 FL=1
MAKAGHEGEAQEKKATTVEVETIMIASHEDNDPRGLGETLKLHLIFDLG